MSSLNPLSGNLGVPFATHLLRRTTYNFNRSRINAFATMTADAAVDALFAAPAFILPEPIDPKTNQAWINSGSYNSTTNTSDTDLKYFVISWWLHEALNDTSLVSKMSFFMHTTFTASAQDIMNSWHLFDHLALCRRFATGNYKAFATKMTIDNLMLNYLNNDTNTATNPNLNYAREFFELFTIGKGPQVGPGDYTNYTEFDIEQAAKVLSGWRRGTRSTATTASPNLDAETLIPKGIASGSNHDKTNKTFSAAFQSTTIIVQAANLSSTLTAADMPRELNDFIAMIFNQDETAKNICRKLYRFFVRRTISTDVETNIIVPLAATLRTNGYDLSFALKQLLKSQHFYDADDANPNDNTIGALIKSPLELVLQSLSALNIGIPSPTGDSMNHYQNFYRDSVIKIMFTFANFNIFYPDNVAGYPAYYLAPDYSRAWFNGASIICRYKLPDMLIQGKRLIGSSPTATLGGVQISIAPYFRYSTYFSNPSDSTILVNEFLQYMLPKMPDANRVAYFTSLFLGVLMPSSWAFEWNKYVSSNDETNVKIPLQNLLIAVLHSEEYQIF